MFGLPIPGFNFEGRTKIGTRIGSLLSIAMLTTTFCIAVVKFVHMYGKHNPDIARFDQFGVFLSANDSLKIPKENFYIAF